MNNELEAIISYMEKDRGIDREILIEAVESAIQAAANKGSEEEDGVRIDIDRVSCEIRAYIKATVVKHAKPENKKEVSIVKAKRIDPDAKIGDIVEIKDTPQNLGRIAAQTAKQAILQKIRQAERSRVYDEYKDRVGEIVNGAVRQFNRSDIIIDLGRAEAILPSRERVPTEEYQVGDRVRAYISDVQDNPVGPCIILSRSHPDFVRALFKIEISEISDGVVEIKGIAREPGYRTKIAVISNDEKVDPVGACVGMRGIRVKNIVRELSGEKIDIIRWSPDLKTYITNSLSPAKLSKVTIDPDNPTLVHIVTDADQLSLAIGKRGQNVRLSAKLLGLKIDIQKDESDVTFEEKVERAISSLAAIEGIGAEDAEKLVNVGFLTIEGILAAEITDIAEMAEVDEDTAKGIREAAQAEHDKPAVDEEVANDAEEVKEPKAGDAAETEAPKADDAEEVKEPKADDTEEVEEPKADDTDEA